jgi:hypothetical protein
MVKPNKDIERIVEVNLPQQEAFLLLIEGASVATWAGADRANIKPKVKGAYEIFWRPDDTEDSTKGCKIISLNDSRLDVQWRSPSNFASVSVMQEAGSTHVNFNLTSDNEQTKIVIRHEGFGSGKEWSKAHQFYEERWDIWSYNLKLLAGVAANLKSSKAAEKELLKFSPKGVPKTSLGFIVEPDAGVRRHFDFSKITLDNRDLFERSICFRNVADQL